MKKVLNSAKLRCANPEHPNYCRYGAKGIKYLINSDEFCAKFHDLWKMMLDEGLRPSIDRIDSDKDYVIDNMRVIDVKDNSHEGNLRAQIKALKARKVAKPCKDCRKEFPLTNTYFHVKCRRKDGSPVFGPRCKDCHKTYVRERAQKRGFWDKRDR